MWLNIHIYKNALKQIQNSPAKIKYNRLTQKTKATKNYIYTRTKLVKAQTGKQKAGCQLENKAMKIKLKNMLRGKERKNRYAKLNRGI